MTTTLALIQGFHTIAAHFGGPHWLINDEDGRTYAQAVNNALRHSNIEATQKFIDYCNLAGIAIYFEGTRMLAGRQARQQNAHTRAHARPQPGFGGPAQIFSFNQPPPPQPPATPQPGDDGSTPPAAEGPFH